MAGRRSILRFPVISLDTLGLISKRPYIFLSSYPGNRRHPFGFLYLLALSLIHKRVYWVFICTWTVNERSARWIYMHIRRLKRLFFKHEVIILANTEYENELLRKHGVWSALCNHNALVDENIFHPNGAQKAFRAIYDARILPYKRHYLASEVTELALIGFLGKGEGDPEIKNKLKNGRWLNQRESGDFEYFEPSKVSEMLNLSKVGLCLSSEEGAMYASIQYLLAGLPVVTTQNLGGRDEFFDPEYVEWVEDNPKAVEAGVDKLIKKNIDPHYIRSRTLEKIVDHRRRFIELIQSILDKNKIIRDFESEWPKIFFNKMQDNSLTWGKIFAGSSKH